MDVVDGDDDVGVTVPPLTITSTATIRLAPVVLSGAYLQRAGVFSLQQPMPPGIKPPQHCASPESFRLDADSTTVFLFRNPSHLHSVLRSPQNIIRLQPLHFSYEKGRRVSLLRPGPGANCHYGSRRPHGTLLPLIQPAHDQAGENASNDRSR
jgi:hypothetical protein